MSKYLETKKGSLEEKITRIATEQATIKRKEPKIQLKAKSYFDVKEGSLAQIAAKVVSEQTDYQAKFKAELEKTGKSINQMSDAEKKAFFDKIDREYKAKNEQATAKEVDKFHTSLDKLVHKSFGKSSDEKNETHTFTTDVTNQKQKDTKGEKDIINPIKEGKMKDIATDKAELKRLSVRLSQLRDRKAADTGDTSKLEREILQTQRSIKDVQLKLKDVPKEVKGEAVNPYAVGMAAAMKQTGDKPPLEKSTITKAHDIAKSIEKSQKEEEDPKQKTYYELRKNIRAQVEKGKLTMTGQKPAVVDVAPRKEII